MRGAATPIFLGLSGYSGSGLGLTLAVLAVTIFGASMLLSGGERSGMRLPLFDFLMPSPALIQALLLDFGVVVLLVFALDDIVHSPMSRDFAQMWSVDLYEYFVSPLSLLIVPGGIMLLHQLRVGRTGPSPVDIVGLIGSAVLVIDRAIAYQGFEYTTLALMSLAATMTVATAYRGVWGVGGLGAILTDGVGSVLFGVLALIARLGPWVFDYVRTVIEGSIDVESPANSLISLALAVLLMAFVGGIYPEGVRIALGYLLAFFSLVDVALVQPSQGVDTEEQMQVIYLMLITGMLGALVGRVLTGRR